MRCGSGCGSDVHGFGCYYFYCWWFGCGCNNIRTGMFHISIVCGVYRP